MTEAKPMETEEVSVFSLATILVRGRWRIVQWMVVGAVVAGLSVMSKPQLFTSSASFAPQGSEASGSGLASLAGQFGVSVPGRDLTVSPDFYGKLLVSRTLLEPIVRDTFAVAEKGGERLSFLDLLEIQGESERYREMQGVKALRGSLGVSVISVTGVVELSVTTPWPSASHRLSTALLEAVNNYDQRSRQGKGAAERRFVEGRMQIAGGDLLETENRLQAFFTNNRQFSGSPELTFEGERLQRDLALKQQIYTSLAQAYEGARIREVRDTPVITVVEAPSLPMLPEPRGRLNRVIMGFLLGGVLASLVLLVSAGMNRGRTVRDDSVKEFVESLEEARDEFLGPLRRLRKPSRS
jgi:uncharacterized protein involved in exopolysaccharide biosynthesis